MAEYTIYRHKDWPADADDSPSAKFDKNDGGGREEHEKSFNRSVHRYDKSTSASARPHDLGWIKSTFANAIEYMLIPRGARGGVLTFSFVGILIGLVGITLGTWIILEDDDGFGLAIAWFMVIGSILFAFLITA